MRKQLVWFGSWADAEHPNRPRPEDHVDRSWDEWEHEFVASHMEHALVVSRSQARYAQCSLCGQHISKEFVRTDGEFIWRSDTEHYIDVHSVRPPQPVIDHVLALAESLDPAPDDDWQWWDNDPYITAHDPIISRSVPQGDTTAGRQLIWLGPWTEGEHDSTRFEDHVDPGWPEQERSRVADHLLSGLTVISPMDAYRECRLCGESMYVGLVKTDGTYLWRTGFAHYVREHAVRPPQRFIEHVNRFRDWMEHFDHDRWQWWDNHPYTDPPVTKATGRGMMKSTSTG